MYDDPEQSCHDELIQQLAAQEQAHRDQARRLLLRAKQALIHNHFKASERLLRDAGTLRREADDLRRRQLEACGLTVGGDRISKARAPEYADENWTAPELAALNASAPF